MVLAINNVIYALMLCGALFCFAVLPNLQQNPLMPFRHSFEWAMLWLGVVIVLHMFVHPDSFKPNLRYLMILGIGFGLYRKVSLAYFDKAFSAMILFFVIYGVYSLIVIGLIEFEVVDLKNWSAIKLHWIPKGNPISLLAEWGTDSYLVFYSYAITRADDIAELGSLRFLRWTGFFVEPSDVAFVIGPLLLICADRIATRSFIWLLPLIILVFMFLAAFSTSGLLAIIFILTWRALVAPLLNTLSMELRLIVGMALFVIVLVPVIFIPEVLLGVVGGNKLAQFEYFKNEVLNSLDAYTSPAYFGIGVGVDYGHRTYGVLSSLNSHGGVVFVAMLSVIGIVAVASVGLIRTKRWFIGAAGAMIVIMFFKNPEVVNLYFFLIGIYVLKVRQGQVSGAKLNVDSRRLE
jgi:hypothetical protein